jgi:hypothetical protein
MAGTGVMDGAAGVRKDRHGMGFAGYDRAKPMASELTTDAEDGCQGSRRGVETCRPYARIGGCIALDQSQSLDRGAALAYFLQRLLELDQPLRGADRHHLISTKGLDNADWELVFRARNDNRLQC